MKYHFEVYDEGKNNLWARCIEIAGCTTQSEDGTMESLQKNMHETLNLCLDEPDESDIIVPLPDPKIKGKNIIEIPADPAIAFSVLLRHYRKTHGLSQKDMMQSLHMKNIYSYQRLEKKGDPKLSTICLIKNTFPDIPFEKYLLV